MTRYDTMAISPAAQQGRHLLRTAGSGWPGHEAVTVICHELERGHGGMQDDLAAQASRRAVLTGEDVDRRKAVLARLQDALAAQGFDSVLVGQARPDAAQPWRWPSSVIQSTRS